MGHACHFLGHAHLTRVAGGAVRAAQPACFAVWAAGGKRLIWCNQHDLHYVRAYADPEIWRQSLQEEDGEDPGP